MYRSRQVTSLDFLELGSDVRQRVTLHREIETVELDGTPTLFLPYHEVWSRTTPVAS